MDNMETQLGYACINTHLRKSGIFTSRSMIKKTFNAKGIQYASELALQNSKDWNFIENAIEKKFQFKDFVTSLGFIVQVGLLAEKKNHHPELYNVYNKVTIRLSTHDAGGVTNKDFELAKAIDEIV